MRLGILALAVLLAGCPAIGPQAGVTPAQTPDSAPEEVSYPAGVGPWGVEDPSTLARAHSEMARSTSYTLISKRTINFQNGSLYSLLAATIRLGHNQTYRVNVRTAGPGAPTLLLGTPPANGAYWSNGTVYVGTHTRQNETIYETFYPPPDPFIGTWQYWQSKAALGGAGGFHKEIFRTTFDTIETELVATNQSNGTRLYHLAGEQVRSSDFARVGDGPVRNVSLDATVAETDLVRRFDLRFDRRVDGEWVTVSWYLAYEDVGSTKVERPPWFDRTSAGSRSSAQDESPS